MDSPYPQVRENFPPAQGIETVQVQIEVMLEAVSAHKEMSLLPREYWDNVDRHIDDSKLKW